MSLNSIIQDCALNITSFEAVQGGDINRAYCLHANETKYFLKVNDRKKYPAMFEKEAGGLSALSQNTVLKIPSVIKSGVSDQDQYLLLEWIESGSAKASFWESFGTGLALLHKKQQPFFGWMEDNFIGNLVQLNHQHAAWPSFYTECRIMPLVRHLFDGAIFSKKDLASAELFCNNIVQLFPLEPPALLHGDLWSGNFMVTSTGEAAIFDPAVYHGHREMDIGITCLFGGFDRKFLDFYNEAYPLEKGWQQRLPFTQLYPILVHAILFGVHYAARAKDILSKFSR